MGETAYKIVDAIHTGRNCRIQKVNTCTIQTITHAQKHLDLLCWRSCKHFPKSMKTEHEYYNLDWINPRTYTTSAPPSPTHIL